MKRQMFERIWSSLFDAQWNDSAKFKMKNYRRVLKALGSDKDST
jgi:hypothetical protein